MNLKVKTVALTAALATMLGLPSSAAPLRRADVPAEPAWVLHLDFDGLRPTSIGKFIEDQMNKPEAKARLAAFQALFSFDLRTQIHGVTLYGTSPAPKDALVLVYADFDADRLVTLAQAARDSQHTSYKNQVIYSWIDEHQRPAHRVYAAITGGCVVFGQHEENVAGGLDVIAGTAPSLASGNSFPQLGSPGTTEYIQGAARKMNLPDSNPHAALLRLSRTITLQVGEENSTVNARLTLDANTPEIAGHMLSILQGIVALGKLQQDRPEQARLANAVNLNQDGEKVTMNIALPSGDVVELIKARGAHKAARKAQAN